MNKVTTQLLCKLHILMIKEHTMSIDGVKRNKREKLVHKKTKMIREVKLD